MSTNLSGQNEPFGGVDADDVAELLSTLKRVEAPGDFDFRVKARIAARRETATGRGLPALVRYGVPAALVLAAAGSTGYYFYAGGDNGQLQAVSAPAANFLVDERPKTTMPLPERDGTIKPSDEMLAEAPGTSTQQIPGPSARENRVEVDNNGNTAPAIKGGSIDMGSGQTRRLFPKGIDPSKTPTSPDPMIAGVINVQDVLDGLGITAAAAANGWTVISLRAGSPADRSGVNTGDLITSINGQPLRADTEFRGAVSVRSLRVIRAGQTIDLAMR